MNDERDTQNSPAAVVWIQEAGHALDGVQECDDVDEALQAARELMRESESDLGYRRRVFVELV